MSTSPRRAPARLLAMIGLSLAFLVPSVALIVPAGATTTPAGNDFSWPQCPKGVGNGLGNPLPSGRRRFEIVGLTNGAGLHENPCLASQWRYANNHASFVTAYTVLTYPTGGQLKTAGSGHFGTCTTLACRLKNNGWAQAAFADASMRRIGAHPPMVWVDVEPRGQQPWTSRKNNNSLVIKAAIAGLQHRGYRVGIYSNYYLWRQVAGYFTRLPEWVAAGSRTAGCTKPFSGGHVWMSQWAHYYSNCDGYDESGYCAAMPRYRAAFQPSHPTVTTSRDSATGRAYARYTSGHRLGLGTAVVQRPAVITVSTTADGRVPLFIAVNSKHRVFARTLGSRWHSLGSGYCAATPGVAVHRSTVWVGCRAEGRDLSLTQVSVDTHGVPAAATRSVYDGSLSGSPSVTVSNGQPVATAKFTDATVRSRTPSTPWTAAPVGTSVIVPTSARL